MQISVPFNSEMLARILFQPNGCSRDTVLRQKQKWILVGFEVVVVEAGCMEIEFQGYWEKLIE